MAGEGPHLFEMQGAFCFVLSIVMEIGIHGIHAAQCVHQPSLKMSSKKKRQQNGE